MSHEDEGPAEPNAREGVALPAYKQLADYTPLWSNLEWVAPDPDKSVFDQEAPTEASRAAEDALLRAAAFETGAVEDLYVTRPGATLTVVEQRDGWEGVVDESGQDARRYYEDQLNAYRFARKYAESDSSYPVSEVMVREVHTIVCASQTTFGADGRALDRGTYKTAPNYVLDRFGHPRPYAPPELVSSELRTLFETVADMESRGCSAIVRAAYLHWALAHVHPFQDGNGRVARVISSIPLLRAWRVPVLVFSDQKATYLQALDAADSGSSSAMVTYTRDRTYDTSQWKRQLVTSHSMRGLDARRDRIDRIIRAQNANHEKTQVVVERVGTAVMIALRERLDSLSSVGATVAGEFHPGLPDSGSISGSVLVTISEPMEAMSNTTFRVTHENGEISIGRSSNPEVTLRLADCTPALTTEAILRIDPWIDIVSQQAAIDLEHKLADQAQKLGTLPYLDPS